MASVVTKKLPQELTQIQIALPGVQAFMAKLSQDLAKDLNVDWKPHCAYRPQNSGQIKRMNGTLKETLNVLETGKKKKGGGANLLPLAFLKVECTPY